MNVDWKSAEFLTQFYWNKLKRIEHRFPCLTKKFIDVDQLDFRQGLAAVFECWKKDKMHISTIKRKYLYY